MNSFDEVFAQVKSYITEHELISDVARDTWIETMSPVELDGQDAVFEVDTGFQQGIIQNNYKKMLEEVLEKVMGFPVNLVVHVVVPIEREQEPTPHIPDFNELEEKNAELQKQFELAEYDYTFDTFTVGRSNEFAYAACKAVASDAGSNYNPLFIYGPSGLGKTHLVTAIKHEINQRDPNKNVIYVTGETFGNELIKAINEKDSSAFHDKYRNADVLIVDDIQFFSGKEQMQEEFFHTYEALYSAHKQIVLTSDRPPREMRNLNDRLRSRFEGGILADVAPPDLETRMAITRNKAAQVGMVLPDETVHYIAEKITSNVRQIEGVVKKLTAYHNIDKSTAFNNAAVDRAIKDVIRSGIYIPTPDIIIEETARYYQLDGADLRGSRRDRKPSLARQIAMYLIKTNTNLSLNQIGAEFGKNHSTVHTSIMKIEELLKSDPDVASTIQDITSNIHSRN